MFGESQPKTLGFTRQGTSCSTPARGAGAPWGARAPRPELHSLCSPQPERATQVGRATHTCVLTADLLCLCVWQGFPATVGCRPPAGRSSAATGAGARSAGRRGSPSAGAWRPAVPATCPCVAPTGGFTKTIVSSTVLLACWGRRLSSSTARTVSLKVGRWLPASMLVGFVMDLLMPF